MAASTTALYAVPRPTDGLAIASFVTAPCGLGLIPVILGHLALTRIRATGAQGSAFAIVGLVLGYLTLAVTVLVVIAVVAAVWWGTSR